MPILAQSDGLYFSIVSPNLFCPTRLAQNHHLVQLIGNPLGAIIPERSVYHPTGAFAPIQPYFEFLINGHDGRRGASHSFGNLGDTHIGRRQQCCDLGNLRRRERFSFSPSHGFLRVPPRPHQYLTMSAAREWLFGRSDLSKVAIPSPLL